MEVPEYYSDGIEVALTMPWTVALTFSIRDTGEERKLRPQVTVRMSPQQAKVTAMFLRNLLKQYEEESGCPINLPEEFFAQVKMDKSQW